MKRSTRGCGCAIAVLVVLLAAGGGAFWKWGLPWLRSRPPKPTGELQVHVLDVGPIEDRLPLSSSLIQRLKEMSDVKKAGHGLYALK